jgi:hypothetical protein
MFVFEAVLTWLMWFFKESMALLIVGLIGLDVLFGIWAALKAGVFDWKKVGKFYVSMVIPLVGGYLTLFAFFALVPGLEDALGGEVTAGIFFVSVLAVLGGSIMGNVKNLLPAPT